ncbi:zinc finger RAD18 domain-containing protein C1orf124 [Gorgonomyces haynaldii]|nr:zinc finger RAD18 domain-containing protein C1orf124 [Gorgonomyces haynaldii]
MEEPHLDLHTLFQLFNHQYFESKLEHIEVRWSPRMTLCAGMCYYYKGGYCSVRLSEPLLKFRPKQDMINTLLHEMIHAYLFVTNRNTDRDGHGPQFLRLAEEINRKEGSNITVYHTFREEVQHYRTHVWKCQGSCQFKPPFYGIVRRSMNRPPQKADSWWEEHQKTCGGEFVKIASPPEKPKKENPKKKIKIDEKQLKLDDFTTFSPKESKKTKSDLSESKTETQKTPSQNTETQSKKTETVEILEDDSVFVTVKCPICSLDVAETQINLHLDDCLAYSG